GGNRAHADRARAPARHRIPAAIARNPPGRCRHENAAPWDNWYSAAQGGHILRSEMRPCIPFKGWGTSRVDADQETRRGEKRSAAARRRSHKASTVAARRAARVSVGRSNAVVMIQAMRKAARAVTANISSAAQAMPSRDSRVSMNQQPKLRM